MDLTPILTVGYGQRSVTDVIELVRRHIVNFVIDVRTSPASKFQPEFNRESLQSRLQEAGIRYVFMGDSLGGRPSDPTCYLDGHVMYELVRQRDFFKAGLERLRNASDGGHRVCLLCAEAKPEDCHRSKLIGAALEELGFEVQHIDNTGKARRISNYRNKLLL